jgi:hypothetical protein
MPCSPAAQLSNVFRHHQAGCSVLPSRAAPSRDTSTAPPPRSTLPPPCAPPADLGPPQSLLLNHSTLLGTPGACRGLAMARSRWYCTLPEQTIHGPSMEHFVTFLLLPPSSHDYQSIFRWSPHVMLPPTNAPMHLSSCSSLAAIVRHYLSPSISAPAVVMRSPGPRPYRPVLPPSPVLLIPATAGGALGVLQAFCILLLNRLAQPPPFACLYPPCCCSVALLQGKQVLQWGLQCNEDGTHQTDRKAGRSDLAASSTSPRTPPEQGLHNP